MVMQDKDPRTDPKNLGHMASMIFNHQFIFLKSDQFESVALTFRQ